MILPIALISNSDMSEIHVISNPDERIRNLYVNFIQERNRRLPNNQELTLRMQKNISDDPLFKIQYSKIFENPKEGRLLVSKPDQIRFTTKYTVIIHFSTPKGYWLVYDI